MSALPNELSRPVPLSALGLDPVEQTVIASDTECAALAERFDLPAINNLTGRVTLVRQPGRIIRVEGNLKASVVRICVVTLEPFDQVVEDTFVFYLTDAPGIGGGDELDVALDDEDTPEPVEGDTVDCGEIVAQHLTLALEPFPRSPEALAAGPVSRADPEPEAANPFTALRGKIR
ncbi:MAG: DUF177 domain-containing protein [Bauldia litoralis]